MYTNITSNTKQNLTLKDFFLCTGYSTSTGIPTGILGASKGTCTFKAIPTIRKPEVNGLPSNTIGFAVIDAWEDVGVTMSMVELTAAGILLALGNASSATVGSITTITAAQGVVPTSKYSDIWVVGYKTDGSKYAILLKNTMNESGLTIATEQRANGSYDIEIKANYTDTALTTPPFTIYLDSTVESINDLALSSISPTDGSSGAVATVVLTFNNAISTEDIFISLASTGAIIAGTKAWDTDRKVLTFTPTSAFASALHIVNIVGVTDVYGQTLDTDTTVFTVA